MNRNRKMSSLENNKKGFSHFKLFFIFFLFILFFLLLTALKVVSHASELGSTEDEISVSNNDEAKADSETDVEKRAAVLDSSSGSESLSEDTPLLDSSDTADSGSSDVVSAIQSLQTDNNNYWELFLDSYPVEESVFLHPLAIPKPYSWRFESNGKIGRNPQSGDYFRYIPVLSGYEYSIYNIEGLPSSGFRIGVVDSIENPSVVTNFQIKNNTDSFTFYPSQDGYLVFMSNQNGKIPSYQGFFVLIKQESYTLSELGNAVMSIKGKLDDVTAYSDYTEYSDEESFKEADFYVSRYEYELLNSFKEIRILLLCVIGMMFVILFVSRRRKNGSS